MSQLLSLRHIVQLISVLAMESKYAFNNLFGETSSWFMQYKENVPVSNIDFIVRNTDLSLGVSQFIINSVLPPSFMVK